MSMQPILGSAPPPSRPGPASTLRRPRSRRGLAGLALGALLAAAAGCGQKGPLHRPGNPPAPASSAAAAEPAAPLPPSARTAPAPASAPAR